MHFKCTHCGEVFKRDMRSSSNKYFLTKSGRYKSHCPVTGRNVHCKQVAKESADDSNCVHTFRA